MSRIGKQPISLPAKVSVTYDKNIVTVKGPGGLLSQKLEPGFELDMKEGVLTVSRPTEQKRHKALHGLYRSLINNMTIGVSTGYQLTLELVGVGYRAEINGQTLDLSLGFSHGVYFVLPNEVSATVDVQKGQNPKILLKSIDKQLLGLVASKIRSIRPPEPYKGKGVRLSSEVVRRKAGKTGGKGKK